MSTMRRMESLQDGVDGPKASTEELSRATARTLETWIWANAESLGNTCQLT